MRASGTSDRALIRFGGPTRESIPILDRLSILAEAGITFFEAHDSEIPLGVRRDALLRVPDMGPM